MTRCASETAHLSLAPLTPFVGARSVHGLQFFLLCNKQGQTRVAKYYRVRRGLGWAGLGQSARPRPAINITTTTTA